MLLKGDPAGEIVKTARDHKVDLIMMSTHGLGAFYRFLVGSVTAKVLHESHCPVWTGAHLEEAPAHEFSIRRVVCSVDLSPHSHHTVSLAAEMAAAVDATLTLVHITTGVEVWGPGGSHVDPVWKEMIVGSATKGIAQLQQDLGTKAEVVIDSGNVPELLNRAAEQARADVMIVGRSPGAKPPRGQRRGLWDHSGIAHPGPERLRTPRFQPRWSSCPLPAAGRLQPACRGGAVSWRPTLK